MKRHFTISAFADEISSKFEEQVRILQQCEIQHIEIRAIDGIGVADLTLDEAANYHHLLQMAGIKVSSIGSPIGKINITDPFEAHLEKFKHVLKIARIFDAPYVRMFSFFIPDEADPASYRDQVIARWHEFLRIAKNYPEITLLHENEKGIYGNIPERCLDLIQSLDDPQLKVAFDPANFVQCNAEVFPKGYEALRPYIAYLHVKDARYRDHNVLPAGMGDGRVPEVIAALAASDFTGFASIEPHLAMFDGFSQLERDTHLAESDNVRQFFVAKDALQNILIKLDESWL